MKKEKMNNLLVVVALIVLCAALMAGCGDKESKSEGTTTSSERQQSLKDNALKNGDMKEGAIVTPYTDENGNQGITYENPDGSGGGGVALD